jgi:O-antigen/teichoic acid export membrane protein
MDNRKALFGSTVMALASTLRVVVQITILPIIGRLLGPRAYGQIALVAPFIFFAMLLAESGLGICIVRAERVTKELEGTVFCFSACFSLFLIAVFALLAYPVGHLMHEPLFPALLLGMSSILVLAALNIVPAGLLLREKRYSCIALSDLASTLGSVAAVGIGILFDWGVWSLVAQQVAFWVCKVAVVTIGSHSRPQFIFRWRIIKENISFGSNLTASSILSFIARNIDNVLIGALMGTEILGYYALAFQVVGLPSLIASGSVYYTVFSGTSEAIRKGDSSSDHFVNALRGVLLLSAPAMVGLAVTAPLSIPLILGTKWLPTIPLLVFLAPLGLVQAMWAPISGVLIGMGRADLTLKLGLISSTATIAAILLGVQFSSAAVALGVSLTAILSWMRAFYKALELCKGSAKDVLRTMSVPLIAALLMGGVVLAVQATLFAALPLGLRLATSIAIGILAYGLILIGLFRDHISADMAMVKVALFSRLRSEQNSG